MRNYQTRMPRVCVTACRLLALSCAPIGPLSTAGSCIDRYTVCATCSTVECAEPAVATRCCVTCRDSTAPRLIRGSGKLALDRPSETSWSENGQDRHIDELFDSKRGGFFIEIGAFDGEAFSNTLLLERVRGWTGLLIEANPFEFERMVAKGRNAHMAHACISRTPSIQFLVGGSMSRSLRPAGTFREAEMDQFLHAPVNLNAHHEAKLATMRGAGQPDGRSVVTVGCTPLTSLLDRIDPPTDPTNSTRYMIDFFSIDVEGAELELLEAIDWDRVRIDVLLVEVNDNHEQIFHLLSKHGYTEVPPVLGQDVLFVGPSMFA